MAIDTAKLGSIKTEILVAWIFALLTVLGWLIGFIFYAIVLGILSASTCTTYFGGTYCAANPAEGLYIAIGVFTFIWMIPSILVFRRTGRMRGAANRGDIATLKQLNSVGWGIVGLIFAGIIPGIMLLIAHGNIEQLGAGGTGAAGATISTDSLDRVGKLKSLLDSGAISQAEYEAQKSAILHPEAVRSTTGVEDELKKLKSLYDSGALTTDEYEAQKKKVLSRM